MQIARVISLFVTVAITHTLVSCGGSGGTESIRVATGTAASESSGASASIYNQAYAYEQANKTKKAIDLYKNVADKYPISKEAPISRYRQADLLYRTGKLKKSFDAFQTFITSYRGTREYADAISKQEEVAHAAATGKFKHNFIGLKSRLAPESAEKMLIQVRNNAPFGKSAPKAQFAIGQLWEESKNPTKAINAYQEVQVKYPKSSLAPEALYRVGKLLMAETKKGNKNKSNIDRARNTFIDLRQLYPNSSQAKASKSMINEVSSQDVKRSYDVAEYYRKKGENTSAAFYYREVIRLTKKDTSLHNLAKQQLSTISQ